ncbi:MAG: glycosyltransferase family 4 protein [Kiritimatiellia bacterium]
MPLKILTNMAFWQSPEWRGAASSIYNLTDSGCGDKPLSAWGEALKLFRGAGGCDVVLTMGARTSLFYALLCWLSARPSRQIMTEIFMDEDRPRNPIWKLKTALFRIAARRAMGILTNSSMEVPHIAERCSIPDGRVRYVPLCSNIRNPAISQRDDGYVLSAGRTLRDYDLLLKAAETLNYPVVLVCGKGDLAGRQMPSNVTVYAEIPKDRYLHLLDACSVVVVPLIPVKRATGQVVVLEAMARGKPVIATRNPGTADLMEHGVNGYLVEPGDADGLRTAIATMMRDAALRKKCAEAGLRVLNERFSMDRHVARKLREIEDLYRESKNQ